VVAMCVGAVWRCVDCRGAVAIRVSGKERGKWHLGAVFVIRGALPGMLFRVLRACMRFVNRSTCLVVGLGANMMGGHWLYKQVWEVVVACCLLVLRLCQSPFVRVPFVRAPFVCWGKHMAPFADHLVGGSICAQGG
jgi:hypothetical protein